MTTLPRVIFANTVSCLSIRRHRYVEELVPNWSAGFVEAVEILDPRAPEDSFLICQHWIADEMPDRFVVTVWANLWAALSAFDHNLPLLKTTPEVLLGFVDVRSYFSEIPWFYRK